MVVSWFSAWLSIHRLVLTEYALLAHAVAYLSSAPQGWCLLKESGLGRWGETDMCCYLALPHIYHGTATVNDGIREVGRGAEQMSCFPSESKWWYVGQGRRWRRRVVKLARCWGRDMSFFSLPHRRLGRGRGAVWEKKDRWNISPCGRENGGKWNGSALYWEMD